MKRFSIPALLFTIAAAFWLICSVVGFFVNSTIDIPVHDTYFIIGGGRQYWPATLLYSIIAFVYYLFDHLKRLSD
jgi:heme/copper-type cytochrome/quinol oxidase subunit 1